MDDLKGLRGMKGLEREMRNKERFSEFYLFMFQFTKKHLPNLQKSLDVMTARCVLEILLSRHYAAVGRSFTAFLKEVDENRSFTWDHWKSLLEFCHTIDLNTLAGYSPDGAWPVLFDEFYEWLRLVRKVSVRCGEMQDEKSLSDVFAWDGQGFQTAMHDESSFIQPQPTTKTNQESRSALSFGAGGVHAKDLQHCHSG